ncbi:MAG: hypothetical protein IKQ37_05575 [Bacteroidaceae bacterium]|nr:hypothetical protein [Bacteroidaceae bacterium]
MKNNSKHIYTLQLTERQAKLLSWACDSIARIIEGQDFIYQDFMESAWEKRCKEATGKMMDKEWDGGWSEMRCDAEAIAKQIKKRFWGLDSKSLYGIHYDESADILWDIHQVIRHQLWLDRPDDMKSHITVDASSATRCGVEPLAIINKIKQRKQNGDKDMQGMRKGT